LAGNEGKQGPPKVTYNLDEYYIGQSRVIINIPLKSVDKQIKRDHYSFVIFTAWLWLISRPFYCIKVLIEICLDLAGK
jgi:hypothetical protein